MRYYSKSRVARKSKGVYKAKRRGVKKTQSRSVKQALVKSVLNKMVETKTAVYNFSGNPASLQSGTTSLSGNYWIVTPSASSIGYTISQGTQNNQRIGNKIYSRSLIVDYVLFPLSYNASTNTTMLPQEVIIYFFKSKSSPSNPISSSDLPYLYENGTATIGPYGYLLDLTKRINKEDWVYLTHRRHKVGRSIVGNSSNLTAANYNSVTNNDFKWNIVGKVNLSKYCPKQIIFPDGTTGPTSTTNAPFIHMLVQTVNADGTIAGLTTYQLGIHGQVLYTYSDL